MTVPEALEADLGDMDDDALPRDARPREGSAGGIPSARALVLTPRSAESCGLPTGSAKTTKPFGV